MKIGLLFRSPARSTSELHVPAFQPGFFLQELLHARQFADRFLDRVGVFFDRLNVERVAGEMLRDLAGLGPEFFARREQPGGDLFRGFGFRMIIDPFLARPAGVVRGVRLRDVAFWIQRLTGVASSSDCPSLERLPHYR
jgi:hypothetical protein